MCDHTQAWAHNMYEYLAFVHLYTILDQIYPKPSSRKRLLKLLKSSYEAGYYLLSAVTWDKYTDEMKTTCSQS